MKKLIILYFATLLLFSIIFILLFHLPLKNFQPVLFYRGLIFLIITTCLFILAVLILNLKKITGINRDSLIAAILVSASLNLSFFVVFPVTIERSVTIFILNSLSRSSTLNCVGLSRQELDNKLVNEYISENKALEKRINEQKLINFLEDDNGCISITPMAGNFLKFTKYVEEAFAIRVQK